MHLMVMKPSSVTAQDWPELLERFMSEVCKKARALGGDVSGEHGIGLTRRRIWGETRSASEIGLTERLKNALDPQGILNPGKIL